MKYLDSAPFAAPKPSKVMAGTCLACCYGTAHGAEHADDCRCVEVQCGRCQLSTLKFDKMAPPSTEVGCKACGSLFCLRCPCPVTIEFMGYADWSGGATWML